jgi:hypothetical protein
VYDLGGGTFDASLVTLDQNVHHVLASEGISTIGGDDFDLILAELALDAAGVSKQDRDELSAPGWFRLLEECRRKKESLHPNSRKLVIDLEHGNPNWPEATVSVADFYEAARPLIEETIHSAEDLLAHHSDLEFEALYLTGGASELPLVARVLKERFGRRVRRSAYTRSATAIGLAIQADQPETYRLSERLQRSFGVWREADAGTRIVFDPILEKGTVLPSPGQPLLTTCRRYSPAHDIGHFRFLECSHRTADGAPSGEVTFWDEIRFPFDPHLAEVEDLSAYPVAHSRIAPRQVIEERYQADSGGGIRVLIANHTAGYEREYQLGRWSNQTKSVKPAQRKKRAAKA